MPGGKAGGAGLFSAGVVRLAIFCCLPFSSITKSSACSPCRALPCLSVTTTSTSTMWVLTRMVGGGTSVEEGAWAGSEPTMNKTTIAVQVERFQRRSIFARITMTWYASRGVQFSGVSQSYSVFPPPASNLRSTGSRPCCGAARPPLKRGRCTLPCALALVARDHARDRPDSVEETQPADVDPLVHRRHSPDRFRNPAAGDLVRSAPVSLTAPDAWGSGFLASTPGAPLE